MSSPRYSIAPAAAYRDKRLTPVAKTLLGTLGTFTERNGWSHPKQSELADSLGVSREYVSRTLRTLVQLGYVETRSFTESRRGRVALEYRVRTDLPDEMVQAAENSRCEPDVISSSHRLDKSLKRAVVIQSSQRADVISSSHRYIESSLREDNSLSKNKHFPENFAEAWERYPQRKRSSKHKSAQAWAAATRAHGAPAVLAAFDAYLGSPDARRDNAQYVPAMERWLRDRLESWVEIAAGKPAVVASGAGEDWAGFVAIWRETGRWPARLGPAPDQAGYRGPAIPNEPDLLSQGGQR